MGRKPFKPQFLSAAEVAALAAECDWVDPIYGLIVRFAAYSGLRAGEIAGLNVGDLDLLTAVPRFTPGGEPAGQFCTRPDVELHVYVPQVVLHRLRAEEEGCSGFLGGVPPPKHPRDLQFLRGQPVEGTVAAALTCFTCCAQFAGCLVGPGGRLRGPQASLATPQARAVRQLGPRELEGVQCAGWLPHLSRR